MYSDWLETAILFLSGEKSLLNGTLEVPNACVLLVWYIGPIWGLVSFENLWYWCQYRIDTGTEFWEHKHVVMLLLRIIINVIYGAETWMLRCQKRLDHNQMCLVIPKLLDDPLHALLS